MPTCASCGRWEAPSASLLACSGCGGVLGQSEARQRAEAEADAAVAAAEAEASAAAAALGLTVDEYQHRRQLTAEAAAAERQAAREAEQAARAAAQPALRAAIGDRLIGEGATQKTANNWIAAWEAEALRVRLPPSDAGYWDAGREWIVAGRALRAEPVWWDHKKPFDFGQGQALAWILFALPVTIVLGVVLLGAFLLLGQPLWIPVIATAIGLVGGSLLMVFVDSGSWVAIDRLAYHVSWVDRHGDAIWDLFELAALAMPSITTIGTAVLLLAMT